jgi:hypothetical protein
MRHMKVLASALAITAVLGCLAPQSAEARGWGWRGGGWGGGWGRWHGGGWGRGSGWGWGAAALGAGLLAGAAASPYYGGYGGYSPGYYGGGYYGYGGCYVTRAWGPYGWYPVRVCN